MNTPEQRDQGNESGGAEGGAAGASTAGVESLDLGAGAAPDASKAGDAKKDAKAKGGKTGRGEEQKAGEAPAWQKPDYTGVLTIEQAEWRNNHLTPQRFKAK